MSPAFDGISAETYKSTTQENLEKNYQGKKHSINIDHQRDDLLTAFGKETLRDRYLLKGESFQELFGRVATYYGSNNEHAQRIYNYISKHWFMPATPVLANGGTDRGNAISCFLSEVADNMSGIRDSWNENVNLARKGGGTGVYWGKVRSVGEKINGDSVETVGVTTGIMPFIKVQDAITLAVSQGGLRRGNSAAYLPINHPEIEEFLDMRRPTGGDINRKSLNLHHGIVIDDKFMLAVKSNEMYDLVSPKTGLAIRQINARALWIRILTTRLETGEPYLMFKDTVHKATPETHKLLNMYCNSSNLCVEIMQPSGIDYDNKDRTAVCCLSSLNLENWDEWKDHSTFIADVMEFLDNVLQDFIDNATSDFDKAKYSAMMERSVGLGVMGFHSYLQKRNVPFESISAKSINKIMFSHICNHADLASKNLAYARGPSEDSKRAGTFERFTYKMALPPTASVSIICGTTSPSVEPIAANVFVQKTLAGNFTVKNTYLKKVLQEYGMDTDEVWTTITINKGSVQKLDFMSQHHKDVFKTAFELDQRYIIDFASDRTKFVDQGQSINIFLPANVNKKDLHAIHYSAWEKGVKSLYYCRSQSIQTADSTVAKIDTKERKIYKNDKDGEDCLYCQ